MKKISQRKYSQSAKPSERAGFSLVLGAHLVHLLVTGSSASSSSVS